MYSFLIKVLLIRTYRYVIVEPEDIILTMAYHVLFQELSITDDTVLEEHNEDPALLQMRLIGDGGKWIH